MFWAIYQYLFLENYVLANVFLELLKVPLKPPKISKIIKKQKLSNTKAVPEAEKIIEMMHKEFEGVPKCHQGENKEDLYEMGFQSPGATTKETLSYISIQW